MNSRCLFEGAWALAACRKLSFLSAIPVEYRIAMVRAGPLNFVSASGNPKGFLQPSWWYPFPVHDWRWKAA
jgi:hypothetical protein